jgi:hypothetical protein
MPASGAPADWRGLQSIRLVTAYEMPALRAKKGKQ